MVGGYFFFKCISMEMTEILHAIICKNIRKLYKYGYAGNLSLPINVYRLTDITDITLFQKPSVR